MLGSRQAEFALVVVEVGRRPSDHVVNRGAGDTLALGDLAVRPIQLPGQVEDATLVVGEEWAVQVEQAQLALPSAGTVKHLALTV